MNYEDIFKRSYMKKYDPHFYDDKEYAYEVMTEWLHEVASISGIKDVFNTLSFDDELMQLTYSLKVSYGTQSDDDFVIKLFTDGFVICFMRPKVDSITNLALMIGGNDEKKIQSNYKANSDRLEYLEKKLKKFARDRGYSSMLNSQ